MLNFDLSEIYGYSVMALIIRLVKGMKDFII